MNPALNSSVKMDWQTPDNVLELVRKVGRSGHIGLDPCTVSSNPTRALSFCSPDTVCGLQANWIPGEPVNEELIYVNPPYGRELPKWVAKCTEEAAKGAEIILLVPARPDTRWFQDAANVPEGPTVLFWKGRLKFRGAPSAAPFPSALFYWGKKHNRFMHVFQDKGMFL